MKLMDCRSETDTLEITPHVNTLRIRSYDETGNHGYYIDLTYKQTEELRDYLTSILEGRETNDKVL